MIEILTQLSTMTGLGQDWFRTVALVFFRVGAALALMPAFGEQAIPQRIRLVLALAFTAIVSPAVYPTVSLTEGLARPALIEAMVGLAIGIAMRLFIMALQMAAVIIAQVTSLSQLFGGTTPEPQPAIGNLLTAAALALAVMSGLHVKAAALFILSYHILPAGQMPLASEMADWGLLQIVQAFSLAFALAAPFVVASVIYNVVLGVINKAMPQLSVFMVGAPVLTIGSMILMMITAPLALGVWLGRFDTFLAAPFMVSP